MFESKSPKGEVETESSLASTDEKPAATAFPSIPSVASGKPYDWSLPSPEGAPLLALSREAMAERTDESTAAIFRSAVVRVAALLTVLSNNNGYEGRDRAVISDDLSCGVVAGMLGIDIDMLQRVLVELESRGLVGVGPADDSDLMITDLAALDRLSEADIAPSAAAQVCRSDRA